MPSIVSCVFRALCCYVSDFETSSTDVGEYTATRSNGWPHLVHGGNCPGDRTISLTAIVYCMYKSVPMVRVVSMKTSRNAKSRVIQFCCEKKSCCMYMNVSKYSTMVLAALSNGVRW